MKTKNKLLLIFFIGALLIIASICGAMVYYYLHPSAVKGLIEKSIARSTGTSFEVKSLSYSLQPLRIIAKGILFKPGEDLRGFYLEIPELIADMSLEGSFGRKRLTFNNLKIDRFSFRVSHDLLLPRVEQKPGGPSGKERWAYEWSLPMLLALALNSVIINLPGLSYGQVLFGPTRGNRVE